MSATRIIRLFVWVVVLCGCSSSNSGVTNGILTTSQVESLLASPDVTTTSELFTRLSKLPIEDVNKRTYADVKASNARYETIEHFLLQWKQDATTFPKLQAAITAHEPNGLEKLIASDIAWKRPGAKLGDVARVYTVTARLPTSAERLAKWDPMRFYDVFADDNGNILGWRNANNSRIALE